MAGKTVVFLDQGLEGYLRDAEKSNGMRDLTAPGEAGFAKIRARMRYSA